MFYVFMQQKYNKYVYIIDTKILFEVYMKNILFTLAVSSLIIQSSSTFADDPTFTGIQEVSVEATVESTDTVVDATQEEDESKISNEDLNKLRDSASFGDEVEDLRELWASNTVLAEGIAPFDFLEKSSIKELTDILSGLTSMVSEESAKGSDKSSEQGKKITRLNKNKKNLDHTKDNLEGKVLWELTIKEIMKARTKGFGDNQNDKRDVFLVRDFLESLKKIDEPKQTEAVWSKVNEIVSSAMPACNPKDSHSSGDKPWIQPDLAKSIIDSFKAAMAEKDLSKFNWEQVATSPFVTTSDEAKHSYYKDAFLYGATVQVYLQLIQTELDSVKAILILAKEIETNKYISNLKDVEIPTASKSLFNEHSGFAIDDILKAFQSEDKVEISRFLYKQFEDVLGDAEEFANTFDKIQKALIEFSQDEVVQQRIQTVQTFQAAHKSLTDSLPTLTADIEQDIKKLGEAAVVAEVPEDSIFERVEGKLVIKASFQEALKNAKSSEDITKLQEQLESAKRGLLESAQAAQKVADDARIAKLRGEEQIIERNAINKKGNEDYSYRILKQKNSLQTLDTPLEANIHNIQTSLRVLNETVVQIGSLYNRDKVTITGIRWENDGETPLSYQIDMKPLSKRLKKAHKDQETGFVSAKYVKLKDESELGKYRALLTQQNNERDALAAKQQQEKEAIATRIQSFTTTAATLNEIVTNLDNNLTIETSYVVRKSVSLNDTAVKAFRDIHTLLTADEKQGLENAQRRSELITQIETFFTDKKITGDVEAIGGFSESSIKKSIQNRVKIVLDWTNDYLDFVTESATE